MPATSIELTHLVAHPKELLDFIWSKDLENVPTAYLEKSVRDWQTILDAVATGVDFAPSRIEDRLIRYYHSRYCYYYALFPPDIRKVHDALSPLSVETLGKLDVPRDATYALNFYDSFAPFLEYAAERGLGAIMVHG